jgi:prepilin-type N-terminal cleavage/methylation domain-containing protein
MVSYSKNMGFTIVELLIVVVVIGILAGVAAVAYNGVTTRAQNAAVLSDFNSWKSAFSLYSKNFGRYPDMPANTNYCLGNGFPDQKCRDYLANNANTYTEASSTALMNELRKVASVPSSTKYPVNGTVGPYVTYGNNGFIGLTIVLKGGPSECPSETAYIWDDGKGRLLCEYAIAR